MRKLEKIPLGWAIMNDYSSFNLVDTLGKVKSSIVYNIEKDALGNKFIDVLSVASKTKRKGCYGILYSGFESFVKSEGANYIRGFVSSENTNSIRIHQHFGFFPVSYFSYGGIEKRIEFRKEIST
jgi:predicted GNAT superfamily acetyltransferase